MSTPDESQENEMDAEVVERFEQAVRRDGRYAPEAFEFLHRGLEAATKLKYDKTPPRGPQHVTGQELCLALRNVARQRWGGLARMVLESWNIRRTRDFGEMVYFMIDLGMMGRQDSDDISDFDRVYDFEDAFDAYTPPLEPGDE